MFPDRYFALRYFPNRYFPIGSGVVIPPVTVPGGVTGWGFGTTTPGAMRVALPRLQLSLRTRHIRAVTIATIRLPKLELRLTTKPIAATTTARTTLRVLTVKRSTRHAYASTQARVRVPTVNYVIDTRSIVKTGDVAFDSLMEMLAMTDRIE